MTGRHASGPGRTARPAPTPPTARPARTRRRPPARWAAAAVALLAVTGAGWLLWTGLRARTDLNQARVATEQLRSALVSGDTAGAQRALADVTSHADRAHGLTTGPVWWFAARLPYFGNTADAASRAATDVDQIARDVLPGLLDVGRVLNPSTLRSGSQIDLAGISAAGPAVTRADARLTQARRSLAAIDLAWVASPVADGIRAVQQQVDHVQGQLDAAATATRLLPPMLGAAGPRNYLVVFQNNAEARGTGGLVGAFGVLQATAGHMTVVRLGSDVELQSATAPVVDLGPHYKDLFGSDPALWANTNLSAHFPFAAVQQLELWRRQFAQTLDGVIALDPVALGYLLTAAGPATLPDGERLTGASVADLTMREVYSRYQQPSQVPERKAFLQIVAKAALASILGHNGRSRGELEALGRATTERRLLVYSAHPAEEEALAATPLAGVVDAGPGPYAGLAIDNASGSKIDYYLDRRMAYALGACADAGSSRTSTITVTLHDGAPASGLPLYAAYRLDRGAVASAAGRGGDGSVLETVLVYAATGAGLTGATLDGAATSVTPGVDGSSPGRPVFVASVELAAGQTRTLVLNLREPSTGLPARGWMAALVRAPVLELPTVQDATCR